MTGSSVAARLGEHPFLHGLGEALLRELPAIATEREFETGATIVHQGDPAHEFFLVTRGKVGLEIITHDRPPLTVLTLGPGEVFGWSWLVPPHRWRADVRALKPTHVWVLQGEGLRKVLGAHPPEAYHFLRRFVPILGLRLDAARLQVLDVHR